LVSEAQQVMQEAQDENLRDCAINAAVIKVEHFEMGSYRGLVTAAQQMGQDEIVNLLQQNLQQEEQTAQIAEESAPELLQKVRKASAVASGVVVSSPVAASRSRRACTRPW
jgi:ferritin-like metal-binding protein YciE